MPKLQVSADLEMHYQVDDYTDPWLQPETILMLHGNCESSDAWYGWVPHLARHFRVVRPDMRGFGASTPMPRDYPWTLDVIVDDLSRLMDALGVERFHLIGAKIGGTMARGFAGRRPDRVRTLTVAGTPTPFREGAAARIPALTTEFAKNGIEPWLRDHGGPSRERFSSGGRRVVGEIHEPHLYFEPDRLDRDGCVRGYHGGSGADRVPDARHHDREKLACHGGGEPCVAAADSELDATGAARRLLSRRGNRPGSLRAGDAGIHSAQQPR